RNTHHYSSIPSASLVGFCRFDSAHALTTLRLVLSSSIAADQVALAIGKLGQNLRLAIQVTKWQIEIKTNEER
ncbi:MAG: hypothetical protein Q8869_02665, partial [Candidatus Phytoplasma australasiaticum]|nr:hypothetical protein [Candidatus Phytoplasma australasiaticum]